MVVVRVRFRVRVWVRVRVRVRVWVGVATAVYLGTCGKESDGKERKGIQRNITDYDRL